MILKALEWIRFRTYNRYHRVNTGLEPGWSDVVSKMLYVNFTMLVDFIEIEKAECLILDDKQHCRKFWQRGPLDNWRRPAHGVKHLEWEIALVRDEHWGTYEGDKGYGEPPHQAIVAKEQLELYNWWIERPNRKDSMELSGLYDYYEGDNGTDFMSMLRYNKSMSDEQEAEYTKLSQIHTSIEEQRDAEDEEMLVRLVKIRTSLWA
jgi:hypothetical protein